MFARTERLLLRPGWSEDAPALYEAIADKGVVCNLGTVPWPYRLADAETFLAAERPPSDPTMLIFRRTESAPELIGTIGLARKPSGLFELGYWIARRHWNRGYATEAGRAVIAAARDGLRLRKLVAGHFVDNPASGRVLEKLGFNPIGVTAPRMSRGRGVEVPCRLLELELGAEDEPTAMAA